MTLKVSHSGLVSEAIAKFVPDLVSEKIASRIFAKDHTLWGKDAEEESAVRLGWVDAAKNALALIPDLKQLRAQLASQGLDRVVLCGMGGSSLAPEVMARTAGKELVVLDSTDPSEVRAALSGDLSKTVVVVSSKSGSTVETDSQKRSFEAAFEAAGIDKRTRIFIVTDPDSPMHKQATVDGYRTFLADPTVGGRYSGLTAFGVVPTMLAGCDTEKILQSAIAATEALSSDDLHNPGLLLGAAIARTANNSGFKDKLGFVPAGSPIVGFGDWVEQLIAESTGKLGRGVLPVVLESNSYELNAGMDDLLLVALAEDADSTGFELAVSGDLGEMMLAWEVATAVASRLLGVNPFDQPDVESAKIAARALLESPADGLEYTASSLGVDFAALGFELRSSEIGDNLAQFFSLAGEGSYLSVHCYLNREQFPEAQKLRDQIAQRTNRPTTIGWGPRFLHSTGQYHKGGPKQGVFLQIVSGDGDDLQIPGRTFGYRQLIDSQASGDAKVLFEAGSKVLVLRLANLEQGIKDLIGALS